MHIAAFILAAQQAVVPSAAHPGQGSPEVEVPRIETAVTTVDGRLDEPAWSDAAVLTEFWQYEPVDGRRAAERTEVLVWYAPDAIHFGIRAYDSEPDAIRATVADRDDIDGDDRVTIYLDTFDDQRRAFFFAVNPLGIQQDGVRTEGAVSPGSVFGGSTDTSPDYAFDSRGRVTGDGYVVEVRIPFKSLRYPTGDPQRWGIQIEREVQRTGYLDTWTDARRASASFLAQGGTLVGLSDLERGIVVETQPFLTAETAGSRRPDGSFASGSLDGDLGANVRVGFSSVSIDATVNPDFNQVEADVGQVTINERFALFFPEKRPFFLEGIELFSTPNQLVHTRQIANPSVGGKVTGKVGGIGIAHLTAVDDPVDGTNDALFNVTRLRRDFAENSLAGITYTDRTVLDRGADAEGGEGGVPGSGDVVGIPPEDGHNRVLAADVRHVFGGMYYVQAQLGRAWTRDPAGERDASLWRLELDRTGRGYGFNYSINGIDDGFVSRAGYVPRAGIIEAHAFNRFTLYGAEGAPIENFTFFVGPTRFWRYDDFGFGDAIEGNEELGMWVDVRGGWGVNASLRRQFYTLDPVDYAGYGIATGTPGGDPRPYDPLDEVSGPAASISVNSPAYRGFDAGLSLGLGRAPIFPEGAEGTEMTVSGELNLRPGESVRLAASTSYERLSRTRDGSRFARTLIPRVQLEVQPTSALFFRAIAEYRSERRAALVDARDGDPLLVGGDPVPEQRLDEMRVDLLASYEPTPGTVAFLGYGASLGTDDAFAFSRLERATDGFFLKLSYRFRR